MNSTPAQSLRIKFSTLAKLMLLAGTISVLQGCPLLIVGAAGGGALVATDRRSVGTQTEDREIQIKAKLQLSNGLPDSAHLNVAVVHNNVLLTGEVPDDVAKRHAEEMVRGIENVKNVIDETAVSPPSSFGSRSNDAYLEGRVKTALIAEKDISANDFKVVSERATIYLMGLVTEQEGAQGALVASQVPGVMRVVKVFRYITPEEARQLSLDTRDYNAGSNPPAAPVTDASGNASVGLAAPAGGAVVNPVATPPGVSQPLGVQTGAPITDSGGTHSSVLK
jgi:osmotically-inducible protein OsmY